MAENNKLEKSLIDLLDDKLQNLVYEKTKVKVGYYDLILSFIIYGHFFLSCNP